MYLAVYIPSQQHILSLYYKVGNVFRSVILVIRTNNCYQACKHLLIYCKFSIYFSFVSWLKYICTQFIDNNHIITFKNTGFMMNEGNSSFFSAGRLNNSGVWKITLLEWARSVIKECDLHSTKCCLCIYIVRGVLFFLHLNFVLGVWWRVRVITRLTSPALFLSPQLHLMISISRSFHFNCLYIKFAYTAYHILSLNIYVRLPHNV